MDAMNVFLALGEGRLSLRSFRMAFAGLQLINNTTGYVSSPSSSPLAPGPWPLAPSPWPPAPGPWPLALAPLPLPNIPPSPSRFRRWLCSKSLPVSPLHHPRPLSPPFCRLQIY